MHRKAFIVFILLMFLSGCTAEEEQLIDEGGIEVPLATAFPNWSSTAHDSSEMNNSMFENESYVAYFSAPWCNHCETSLDAYDQVLPEGKMMIFSFETDEDYRDMNAWHNKTETNLNRTIDRPFMLNPPLAQAVGMNSLPFVLFVNQVDSCIMYKLASLRIKMRFPTFGNRRNQQLWMRMAAGSKRAISRC